MGFFNPGLGFASTAGAFIGGAAAQANSNITAANAQSAQDEKIWIAKFADSLKTYEADEDKKQTANRVYQTAKTALGGSGKAADMALSWWMANPKSDVGEIVERIKSNSSNLQTTDENYQSDALNDLSSSLARKYKVLQSIQGNMRPNMQRMFPLPQQPSQYGTTGPGASGGNYGANTNIPSDTPVGQSTNTAPQMAAAMTGTPTDNQMKAGQPPSTQLPQTTQSAPTGQESIGMGGMSKDLIRSELGKYKREDFNTPEGYTRFMDSVNKAPFNPQKWDYGDVRATSQQNDPSDPRSWAHFANRDELRAALIRARRDPSIANGAMTNQEIVDQKTAEFRMNHPNYDLTPHDKVYSTRLNKSIDALQNSSELATDATNAIESLASGRLKTNATQPVFDMFNKALSSMGVDDLQKLGLANNVSDYNMLQKVITRMQFGQIPNYHLGRWTEREVGMLNQMIASGRTDENTNIKISLLIKKAAERGINSVHDQAVAATDGSHNSLVKAREIENKHLEELKTQTARLPWIDTNRITKPEEFLQQWNAAPPGTWFQNTDPGPSSGQMMRKPLQ